MKNTKMSKRPLAYKIMIAFSWTLAATTVICIIFLCVATWYLTPDRLSRILSRSASENLKANVKVENARFTLWSTFPHFCIETDSIIIVSNTLKGISPDVRERLPEGCDSLASISSLKGSVNIPMLLAGKIHLRNLTLDGLALNLVAVNDSLANYNIFPTSNEKGKIPYFTTNKVSIINPHGINYHSDATLTTLRIKLQGLSAIRSQRDHNQYILTLPGQISANVGNLTLLDKFPFVLEGHTLLHFNPFNIAFKDYSVKLGHTFGRLNMDLDLDSDMGINDFSYTVNTFNLLQLLNYFPNLEIPYLSRVKADINLEASARLINPYKFTANTLPSLVVDFKIPDGNISYTVNSRENYSMRHIGMKASLIFDGDHPDKSYIDVPRFALEGEGMRFDVEARVDNISESPSVDGKIRATAMLESTGKKVAALRKYRLKGKLLTDADIHFSMTDLRGSQINDFMLSGTAKLSDYAATIPSSDVRVAGESVDLSFSTDKMAFNNGPIPEGDLNVALKGKRLTIGDSSRRLKSDILSLTGKLSQNRSSIDISTLTLRMAGPGDSLILDSRNLILSGNIIANAEKKKIDSFALRLKGDILDYAFNGSSLRATGIDCDFSAARLADSLPPCKPFTAPTTWSADNEAMRYVRHSSEFLTVAAPETLKKAMRNWKIFSTLKVGTTSFRTPSFPVANKLSDIDMAMSFDSIDIHRLHGETMSTNFDIHGKAGNLRQFLNSPVAAPLRLDLDVALDTVNINRLARAYETGQRLTRDERSDSVKETTPDDTLCMLIPRNITANINATAKMTQYTNLRLHDLATSVSVSDGDARIENLKISADFGKAFMKAAYLTSDVNKMEIQANVDVIKINIVEFFKNYHTLLLMMPQMKNLSGYISAECGVKMLLFPDMYANVPSLKGDIFVQGRDLVVKQNQFIRHITRMMLLREKGDIHIHNMNVHASVHDNLLELYPFDFEFDRYRLSMGGLNNFDGKLYYHIGVNKSPVPFPFGINIVNYFHHPEIRFGGAGYKIKKGEEITSSVMEDNSVNIVKEARRYIKEFIHKAAESDTSDNSQYIFNVSK